MRKRILSLLLSCVMLLSLLPVSAFAAAYTANTIESKYFYNQLNDRAKAIYDKLLSEFTGDGTKAKYYGGTEFIDIVDLPKVTQQAAKDYLAGNKDIFNDFCAAKDALDLDHSELWYIDSGFLTFRVTEENGKNHILIGPGRGPTYLLNGTTISDVATMDANVNATINGIVSKAVNELNANSQASNYSKQDKISYLVRNIHDQITTGIHYRYETECRDDGVNARYIRTIYGIQTHEGVCEAYSRTLQVALRRAGIECVLIHGIQSKGTPEDHMWNAVNIPDDDGTAHWYVVDATWDDPLVANYDGTRNLDFKDGLDGNETNTYLLVGQTLVGEYWNPSGYVSTGTFEFKYPEIETYGYSGAAIEGDFNGLEVKYSAGGTQEDSIPAGVFSVTYKGMNAAAAREKGLYFMVKMYDFHPDGTSDVMKDWYYADAAFILASDNPYFGDLPGGLRIDTSTCEYVDIAVTNRVPEHRNEWSSNPATSYLSNHPDAGYFQGDESEIVAQTGMLYNMNAGYEAPPYVKSQTPAPNGNATAGYEYRFKVTYDDLLYHILPTDTNALNGISTVDAFEDNYAQAKGQTVQVRYYTEQEDLHNYHAVIPHQVVGDLPFDKNRDGIVDMTDNSYVNFKWIYANDPTENGGRGEGCHHHTGSGQCNVNAGCPIVGVEFNFRASDQWIDDVTQYTFSIEGVVGSRSNKYPNNFSVIAVVPGLCPACYRSQGIDWNLWGQPTLLDAPENLDLYQMAKDGGTDEKVLADLNREMNKDDLNGRLMLVVEDKSKGSGNRQDYEEINDKLTGAGGELAGQNVAFSSVFEINFNRICPMVKLKPNQGQSLRVQVGYPAGVTYDSLGRGEYELKAYHFTRCAENETKKCPNANKEGHKWGEDIIGVDEITVVPTPYGMVIMCNAFSPFEIVAIKKDGTAAVAAAESQHDVVVVSDMNGVVKVGGRDAIGKEGNLKVNDGASLDFTVQPKTGYSVDTISFGGDSIEVNETGSYTLSEIKKSDVLNVTFLPDEVKKDETGTYGSTVVAKVCTHGTTEPVVTDNEHQSAIEPTCTTEGYKLGTKCTICGQILEQGQVIPATGHVNTTTLEPAIEATCTTGGKTAHIHCNDCNTDISTVSEVQALGHLFKKYTDTTVKTCQGTQVQATCSRKGCTATDTKFEDRGNVDHKFSVLLSSTEATCTQESSEKWKCQWCEETTMTANTKAKGHVWNNKGICTVCEEYRCQNGHTNTKDLPAKEATCTETGLTAGKQCLDCGTVITEQSPTPAKGHQYETEHSTNCSVCGHQKATIDHTPETIPTVAATCTKTGLTEGIRCKVCGEIIKKQDVVEMIPHSYDPASIKWIWSETNGVSAVAEATCTTGNHTDIFPAKLEEMQTKAPTCTDSGEGTYTAVVTIGGQEYNDTDNGKTLPIPATGHTFNPTPVATTPATCTQHATKTYECTVCGDTETFTDTETPLADHQVTFDPDKTTPATCTSAGSTGEICVVCGQEVAEPIPALGHDYVNGVCTRCGARQSGSSGGSSSGGSGSSSSGDRTTTTTDSSGTRTSTTVHEDGSVTETKTTKSGVVGKTETDKDGHLTSASVTVPAAAARKGTITVPVEVEAVKDSKDAPKITVKVQGSNSARMEIPVTEFGPGTVAVLVHEDGTEEIVRDCVIGKNGVVLNVTGDVTLKIVDNTETFKDVEPIHHWATDAVEFVAARELFKGIGNNEFAPDGNMNRGMLVTVLYRLTYEPETVAGDFGDVAANAYYADAVSWAESQGVVQGYGDGSFGPEDNITRDQLVTILYRYAKKVGYTSGSAGSLTGYEDADSVSDWAVEAMSWAVGTGLVTGKDSTHLVPKSNATRAEVATIFMRFCDKVVR